LIPVESGGRFAADLFERNIDRAWEMLILIALWRKDVNQLCSFRDQSLNAIPVNVGWHADHLLALTPQVLIRLGHYHPCGHNHTDHGVC
jgi:hypothetical protein